MGHHIELFYKSNENFDFEQYLKTIKPSDEMVLPSDSNITIETDQPIE
jgi:hypothetical protein